MDKYNKKAAHLDSKRALSRRKILQIGSAMLGATALPASLTTLAAEAQKKGKNILLVSIDDMRPTLGVYGAPLVKSPNIDAFANNSLIFDQAFIHQAICAPSRITLMTGLRPDTTGIYGLQSPISETMPEAETMNQTFKNAGYETLSIGKIYHHLDDAEDGWSKPPQDAYRDNISSANKLSLTPENFLAGYKWNETGASKSGKPWRAPPFEAADVGDFAYPDGLNTLHAIQELHRFAYTKQPFLFCFGFHRPHLAFTAPKKYWDLYDPADIQLPELRQPPTDAPPYALGSSGETRNYAWTEQDRSKPFTDEFTRKMTHGYLACVSYVDALFGRIIDTVQKLELQNDTVIAIWGDHGYKLGEYGQFNKHTNFEIDTRIPLIVQVPGMKSAGQRTDAIIETVDVFPTFLDLADIPIPPAVEGTSFVPVINKPRRNWKKAAFHQYPRSATIAGKRQELMGYAVRTDDYRYVAWVVQDTEKIVSQELYDHIKDPQETVNVAYQPAYKSIVKRMEKMRLEGWKAAQPSI